MRITIIPSDKYVSIDGKGIHGVDLNWIPEFVGDITGISQKVHALQWYDDHGEIELITIDSNIHITELGVFEQVITKFEERKLQIEQEEENAINNIPIEKFEELDVLIQELEQELTNEVSISNDVTNVTSESGINDLNISSS